MHILIEVISLFFDHCGSGVFFVLMFTHPCLFFVPIQSGYHVLKDLVDSEWHVFGDVVHCLQDSVREESVLSKQGFNSWLKSFALHADLLWSQHFQSPQCLLKKISACFWYRTTEDFHLQHLNVIAKCLQSHFKHDFLGQVAGPLKDQIALQGAHLVVARELSWVHNGSNLIILQSISNHLS